MARLAVTGGSGLVGRHITAHLRQRHEVAVLDLVPPPLPEVRFIQVDILDLEALEKALAGCDVVVHMAAIPLPLEHPPERVFLINALGTFNVLEAAVRCGVKRLVFFSSESVLGFSFMEKRIWPDYLPIDEDHPLRPQDPYALSKLVGEEICRAYSRRFEIQTIALRPPWIWVPEEAELHRALVAEPARWYKGLWAYIWVYDLAEAVELSLMAEELPPHAALFVAADDNGTGVESRLLVARYYPEVKRIASDFGGRQSLISSARARRLLGWRPRQSWRSILDSDDESRA